MSMAPTRRPSREELFGRVWARPIRDVARELGISDVALGKLCRRLQVPTPPRGYWAKVQAGKTPKKPPLEAFLDSHKRPGSSAGLVAKLSRMQHRYLSLALAELRAAGTDTTACDLIYDGIRAISPGLAADVLIYIQHHYEDWLPDDARRASYVGAAQSIRSLAAKLLPHASAQVVVFRKRRAPDARWDDGTAVVVRLSPGLLQVISRLREVARDLDLGYAARSLALAERVLQSKYAISVDELTSVRSELCVSADRVWVRCRMSDPWHAWSFDSESYRIRDLLPVDQLPADAPLPPTIRYETVQPYEKRLKALKAESQVLEMLTSAVHRYREGAPEECLRLADRLWFTEESPFTDALDAVRTLDARLDAWEQRLEREHRALAQDLLGVSPGDVVISESRGKPVRLLLHSVDVLAHDDQLQFILHGTRYRKDGTLGKLTDVVYLQVERTKS